MGSILALLILCASAIGFIPQTKSLHSYSSAQYATASSTTSTTATSALFSPPLSSNFERIDDVIMGGVSKSSLGDKGDYMNFQGILREQDGGFCGFRTGPFARPIDGSSFDGIILRARFTSDSDSDKRTFKLTIRDDETRGEFVFQQMFDVPPPSGEWHDIKIPFDSLKAVRGPIINPNAKPFNSSNILQVGVVISKFKISSTMETLEDFRPGFFSMDFKEIGMYGGVRSLGGDVPAPSFHDSSQKKSPLLKVLGPLFKLVFSETSRRRRAAYLQLKKRSGKGWFHIAGLGFKARASNYGLLNAMITFGGRMSKDGIKFALGWTLKVAIFYPTMTLFRLKKRLRARGSEGEERKIA